MAVDDARGSDRSRCRFSGELEYVLVDWSEQKVDRQKVIGVGVGD